MIEIARITVPARFTNSQPRHHVLNTVRMLGIRYGGSSMMNGGGGAFSRVASE